MTDLKQRLNILAILYNKIVPSFLFLFYFAFVSVSPSIIVTETVTDSLSEITFKNIPAHADGVLATGSANARPSTRLPINIKLIDIN